MVSSIVSTCKPSVPSPARRAGKPGSQARISCDPQVVNPAFSDVRVYRGIDFLKVSFWVDWEDLSFLDLLEAKKLALQKTELEECSSLSLHGYDWNVFRTGTHFFSYRLQAGDVVFLISRRISSSKQPSIRLEIGSLTSQTDLHLTINSMRIFLERCGATIAKEQVSEVHLAADFIGLDFSSLSLDDVSRWVSRGREFNSHYSQWKFTGCSLGKGDIMLRCYDKVLELKRSEHKQEVFCKLWNLSSYDALPVTRVEYQIRRPVLKTFKGIDCINGLSTVNALFDGLFALWRYCTHDWSRFMANSVDRAGKNQSHQKISYFWEVVKSVVWSDILDVRRVSNIKHKDLATLRKQVLGGMMSIIAFYVDDIYDFKRIKKVAHDIVNQDLSLFLKFDEDEFYKRMMKKRNEAVFDVVPF